MNNKSLSDVVEEALTRMGEVEVVGRVIRHKHLVVIRDLSNLDELTEEEMAHANRMLSDTQHRPVLVLTAQPYMAHSGRFLHGFDIETDLPITPEEVRDNKTRQWVVDQLIQISNSLVDNQAFLDHCQFPTVEREHYASSQKIPGLQRGGFYGRPGQGPSKRKGKRR